MSVAGMSLAKLLDTYMTASLKAEPLAKGAGRDLVVELRCPAHGESLYKRGREARPKEIGGFALGCRIGTQACSYRRMIVGKSAT